MSSINIDAFFDPAKGEAAKFDSLGDSLAGIILDVEMVPDQFNVGAQVLKLKVGVDGGATRDLYVRSGGMKDALGEAVVKTGSTAIDVGAQLAIAYSGDKALRNGKSMKLYTAKYEPPQPMGAAVLGETEASL
jgi:hypothetical protein